jgi:hypothetical protein
MRLRAIEIPFRFFAAGDISWQQQEHLVESIDRIVWSTFNQLKHTVIGEKSLLTYFQESILDQVSELLQQRHGLQLLPQDEANYKSEDICNLMSQLSKLERCVCTSVLRLLLKWSKMNTVMVQGTMDVRGVFADVQ